MSCKNENLPYRYGYRTFLPTEYPYYEGPFLPITYRHYDDNKRSLSDKILIDQSQLNNYWDSLFSYDSATLCSHLKTGTIHQVYDSASDSQHIRFTSHQERHLLNLTFFHLCLYSNRPFRDSYEQQFFCYCLQTYESCSQAVKLLQKRRSSYRTKTTAIQHDYYALFYNTQKTNHVWYKTLLRDSWVQTKYNDCDEEQQLKTDQYDALSESGYGSRNSDLASLASELGISLDANDLNFLDDLDDDPFTRRAPAKSSPKTPEYKINYSEEHYDEHVLDCVDNLPEFEKCYAIEKVEPPMPTDSPLTSSVSVVSLLATNKREGVDDGDVPIDEPFKDFRADVPVETHSMLGTRQTFPFYDSRKGCAMSLIYETPDTRPP